MNKGFSLVELIVVIAIMAILVGVAVPVYTGYISKAEEGVEKQYLGELTQAINTVYIDYMANGGDIPETLKLDGGNLTAEKEASDTKTYQEFLDDVKAIVAAKDLDKLDGALFTIEEGDLSYSCDKLAD